ncbi:urea amidolyase associated protein UAAP1 [Kitasatospora sp. NPDC049285]|uniref:urea amidolyase associated protein UAAP1 n=1 Tax=Kitasatospora sp. NPDC049285 TaxID=3157096 RepID=UPI003434BEB5
MTETTAAASGTATTGAAREHARAQAGAVVDCMPMLPPPDGALWAETVPGGGYAHLLLPAGAELELVDRDGDACAHLLLYLTGRTWERLNPADTAKVQWNAYLGAGSVLLSDQGRVLATVLADGSGRHDLLTGTSARARNEARYGDGSAHGPSPAGRELFTLAAAKHGLGPRDLAPSVSLFQGVRAAADGSLRFTGSAGPGSRVLLRAELPLTVLVANTAHPLDPRPEYRCTPLLLRSRPGRPTGADDPLATATPERLRAYLNTLAFARSLDSGLREER